MTGLLQDLRFALRQGRARPLFAATAMATIALGIGANTAIFSVVYGLLIAPLPYEDGDRLAFAWRASATSEMMLTPDGELIDAWRAGARSVESIEAWTTGEAVVRTAAGPRAVSTGHMSEGFLAALRLEPLIGRGFTRLDEDASAEPVVLLASGFWRSEFGGARDVTGRVLTIGGTAHTIIGVAPPELQLPLEMETDAQLWLPLRRHAQGHYINRGLRALVRRGEGETVERVEAELSAIGARVAEASGDDDFPDARLVLPRDMLGPSTQRALLLLLGAVGCVLLIACANVANLLLVRASARETELAVRAALGAGRGRLLRQLLVESLLLGAAGGITGLVLAWWGLDLIVAIRPDSLAALERVRIDGRVAAYAAALAIATSLLFGLLPGLRAARNATLSRSGTRTIAGGRTARRLTSGLIIIEVALSLVLLVGAGLLVRTFLALNAQPLNFEPSNLWSATIELPATESGEEPDRTAFHRELRAAVAGMPGIRSALNVNAVPSEYGIVFGAPSLDGGAPVDGAPSIFAASFVEPDYFAMLRMRFVEGRAFTADDGANVVIVGEAFARRYFEGEAVGHTVRLGEEGEWRTIVGVAADIPAQGLARSARSLDQLHFPAEGTPAGQLLIDTELSAATLAPALRAVLADIDSGAALAELQPLDELLAGSLDRQRFNVTLLLALAVLATLLSAVGLYGVVSVAVSGRTREIGIRRALGASDAGVIRLALLEGLRPSLIGLGVGLVAALGLARLMTHLLYGLSPRDPMTLAVVPVVLACVALFASWLPGRRAARIQPVEALRLEG